MSNEAMEELTTIAKNKGIPIDGVIGVTHDSEWDNAPDWAKWKAQSADGSWEWFSTKPQPHNFGLYVVGTFMPSGKGQKETIRTNTGSHYMSRPNPEWRSTVSKRPKEQSDE